MRILHTEASRGWGGQEFRILAEMRAMRARGHELWLAAAAGSPVAVGAEKDGFPVLPLPFSGPADLGTVLGLRGALRRHRIDVLNPHSARDGWSSAVAGRLVPGAAVVRTRHLSIALHNNWPTRWVYTRGCDHIVTTGEALRLRLMADNGLDGRRITSVPTGVDLQRFDPARHDRSAFRRELGAGDGEQLVGTVAMLRRMKGHPVLLAAAARVLAQRPGTRFVLVGDVPPTQSSVRTELEAQARALGIADRVVFTGYREDIPAILAGLDLVVLPSIKDEGVPQGLAQAMAMGRPVIATSVGAVEELVVPGRTGLVVPPGDEPALTAAILATLGDPAATAARTAAARSHVLDTYSVEAMALHMEQVYGQAIAFRHGGC